MLENSDDYRNKSFIEFWKSERSPFLFISSILIGLGLSIFLIIHSFLNEVNLTGGLFFLGFVLIAYLFYFHIMYGLYRNGYLIYTSIKCNKQVLPNVKIYNGNVDMKFLGFQIILDKGASFPSYDFNKADIILTDYSIILLGTPASFTNFLYLAPIELTFGKKRTNYAQNQAKIIDYENLSDRVILHVTDDYYQKTIKINIKSEVEIVKQWLTSVNLNEFNETSKKHF